LECGEDAGTQAAESPQLAYEKGVLKTGRFAGPSFGGMLDGGKYAEFSRFPNFACQESGFGRPLAEIWKNLADKSAFDALHPGKIDRHHVAGTRPQTSEPLECGDLSPLL
jgi:hypothetical protein